MGKAIGIDLGTTNSCVAIIEQGDPLVIPNDEGSRTTPPSSRSPTTVSDSSAHRAPAGRHQPPNTLYAVKRLIGRRFDDEQVDYTRGSCPSRSSRPTTATPG
jgi:molecular chaperone DnaK